MVYYSQYPVTPNIEVITSVYENLSYRIIGPPYDMVFFICRTVIINCLASLLRVGATYYQRKLNFMQHYNKEILDIRSSISDWVKKSDGTLLPSLSIADV